MTLFCYPDQLLALVVDEVEIVASRYRIAPDWRSSSDNRKRCSTAGNSNLRKRARLTAKCVIRMRRNRVLNQTRTKRSVVGERGEDDIGGILVVAFHLAEEASGSHVPDYRPGWGIGGGLMTPETRAWR